MKQYVDNFENCGKPIAKLFMKQDSLPKSVIVSAKIESELSLLHDESLRKELLGNQ